MSTTHQWAADPVSYDTVTRPRDDYEDFSRSEFGGLKIGAAFFGWLCAHGMAVLLTGLTGAGLAVSGVGADVERQLRQSPDTAGIVVAAVLLVVLALAYYSGGYVAGRLARFDGRRQAFAVWFLGVLVTGSLVGAALFTGTGDDLSARFGVELPSGSSQAAIAGLVALGVALLVTLLVAVAGGKAGERYHRRVDRVLLNL